MARRLRAAAVAAPLAAALALAGCGYDPADPAQQTSAEQATAAAADEASAQQAGHLVADARVLLELSQHVLEDPQVPGPVKSLAGQVKGAAEAQIRKLGDHVPEGSSAIPEQERSGVLGASGEQAAGAYDAVLRAHLHRLQQSWSSLKGSADEAIAGVARDMEARMAEIASQLP
ncbi:hypothetical protein [Corynebacterium sp. 335C]